MNYLGNSIDNFHIGDVEITEDLQVDGNITADGTINGTIVSSDITADLGKFDTIQPKTASGDITVQNSASTDIIKFKDDTITELQGPINSVYKTSNIVFGVTGTSALTSGLSNVIIGKQAASALTTGNNNILMGKNALNTSTLTSASVVIGSEAGKLSTDATDCVIIGEKACLNSTDTIGLGNVIIGNQAGSLGTGAIGASNVMVGYKTGWNISSGIRNVCVGGSGGNMVNSGTRNTFLGHKAGADITTGNRNIFIGHDNAASGDSEYNIVIGDTALLGVITYRNVLIGSNAYSQYSDSIGLGDYVQVGAANQFKFGSSDAANAITEFVPGVTSVCDIGSSSFVFNNLYMDGLGNSSSHYQEVSETLACTSNNITGTQDMKFAYLRIGKFVCISWNGTGWTGSGSTGIVTTPSGAIDTEFRPLNEVFSTLSVTNGGTNSFGLVRLTTGGTMTYALDINSTGFSGSGTQVISSGAISYYLF